MKKEKILINLEHLFIISSSDHPSKCLQSRSFSFGAQGSASPLILPGLLGGGGADDKKVLNSKPSARSRTGVLFNLRRTEGPKVVCHTLADGHKVAKEMESSDTASVASSEAPSVHAAYDLNLSLDISDGNS